MYKFKDYISNKDDFNTKVVDPIKLVVKDVEWLNSSNKYYSVDLLVEILRNQYNERYVRYEEPEFIGYFKNLFLTYTPMFYAKVSNIIEDTISTLQTNANVGKKTVLKSNTKRASSTQPYNNIIGGDMTNADGKDQTDYQLDTGSENIIDNAKKLSSAKINGEVSAYVNSFSELFTNIDMDEEFTKHIGAKLTELIIANSKAIQVLSKNPLSNFDLVNVGGREVIQPKRGMDIQMSDDSGNPIVPTSPNSVATVAVVETAKQIANSALTKATSNEGKINAMSGGVKIYHYSSLVEATNAATTHSFNTNDLAWIGQTGDWKGYHFINGVWVANGTVSKHEMEANVYSREQSDSRFEAKSYDYSDVDTLFYKVLLQGQNGTPLRGQNIVGPVSEKAPTGTVIKLRLKDGNAVAGDLPVDTDGFYYNGNPVWRVKGSDIANYSEIKSDMAAGKIMVGIKQADGSLVLEPWELPKSEWRDVPDSEAIDLKGEYRVVIGNEVQYLPMSKLFNNVITFTSIANYFVINNEVMLRQYYFKYNTLTKVKELKQEDIPATRASSSNLMVVNNFVVERRT